MDNLQFPHIFVEAPPNQQAYTSPVSGRDNIRLPDRPNRIGHAEAIRHALEATWAASERASEEREAVGLPVRHGTYIEFLSTPDFDLKSKSLDLRSSGIRLLNVAEKEDAQSRKQTYATIFVPSGKEGVLLRRVIQYRDENTQNNNPRNNDLVRGIESLHSAILESFWRDPIDLLPDQNNKEWCEVWLRQDDSDPNVLDSFINLCLQLEIEVLEGYLTFPERTVVQVKASTDNLNELILSFDYVAEFRLAKSTAEFWMNLSNADQTDWVESLAGRISITPDITTSLCVVDTGANNGHILLEPFLSDEDSHTIDSDWGTNDQNGHGTMMCGLALYGVQLDSLLQSDDAFEIPYKLESVKLIPNPGSHHERDLYGLRSKQAISRAEIQNPDTNRIICLAITSEETHDFGRPTSWSASIDQLCFGEGGNSQRVIIVAGGNIREPNEWLNYPNSNITKSVNDPAQSWNAITVGSVTSKTQITDTDLASLYSPIAREGQLSPFSTTSCLWDSKWPNKPDVVFEGGNAGRDNNNFSTEMDDLSILTTNSQPQTSQLALMNATSASSAQVARFASLLQAYYPNAWPETIRALIIHSAEWTDELWEQFADPEKTEKQNYERMLRAVGYGVPNMNKALESATNSLTLIAEEYIQPFTHKPNGGNEYKTNEMHLYELPWPVDALKGLPGETPVTIDVTLSYYIEPAPGEIGWKDKYRYRSHGLDFNIKKPEENQNEFVQRLNKAAREVDVDEPAGGSSIPWAIGDKNGRTRGSVHRDWWVTTAASASDSNVIGIFPKIGWWKERYHLNRGEEVTRYSLIISISTPTTEVDIYTPVAITTPVETSIEVN